MPTSASTFNWAALEDAVFAWVQAASGYGPDLIRWSDQDVDAPTEAHLTIKIDGPYSRGGTADTDQTFDAGAPLGEEVTLIARKLAEVVIRIRGYAPDVYGSASAKAVLERIQTALSLEVFRDPLNAAGLGIVDEGEVFDTSALAGGTQIEGSAALDVRGLLMQTATATVGYIASVELTDETIH